MQQANTISIWDAGFKAGMDGSFDDPAYPVRDDRITWRQGWMAAKKVEPLLAKSPDEHAHQAALFRWSEYAMHLRSELKVMFAVPNGGLRAKAVAGKLRAEGVKAGVPDVCLPIRRGMSGCLFVELKAMKGRVSTEQKQWIDDLALHGNTAVVCFGFESARQEICEYLQRGI